MGYYYVKNFIFLLLFLSHIESHTPQSLNILNRTGIKLSFEFRRDAPQRESAFCVLDRDSRKSVGQTGAVGGRRGISGLDFAVEETYADRWILIQSKYSCVPFRHLPIFPNAVIIFGRQTRFPPRRIEKVAWENARRVEAKKEDDEVVKS